MPPLLTVVSRASRQDERSTAVDRGAGDRAAAADIDVAATVDGRGDGAAKRVDVEGDAVADGVSAQYVTCVNNTCGNIVIGADRERAAARNRERSRSVQGQGPAAED